MAITKKTIESHLEALNIYHKKEKKGLIAYDPDAPSVEISIVLMDGGRTMRMIARSTKLQNLLKKKNRLQEKKCELFEELLRYNAKTKFGTWELSGDELRYAVEFPIEDGTVTQNQFARMFRQIDVQSKRFDKIIKTLKP
ncbi:hypothetical protein [Hydrogenimonas sp.]|uniref:hypothetical protein n=1 Tax=Hydrogenimonas sp. TaxID=2231112 RepID=UPI002630E4CF|nr:hypothetical protein [Hydrogenimonas sp.]